MASAKTFFNEQEKAMVIDAIREAESHTSGEIRVHLENICFGHEVRRAQQVFTKLGMHQTKERNGILIYIAVFSRKIAVVGDQGIHEKLGDRYWKDLIASIISNFKANRKAEGLAEGIIECGKKLAQFFPVQPDDINELSNDISY